ncbi:MAG: lipopolysaccharide biosynthesis protein [Bacteroidales bacterium]|nr:lipopolysaccharide biosynthesis protein [Bacteroidales bacterium]MCM1205340.1 lipopolysaccharide biosynthesis protein [Bacillota bacterium]
MRMLFQLIVGLLTARFVFNTLGVVDYGIYGVVGGVVAMFSFINGSMSNATMRFLTFELGKGTNEKRLREIFSTAELIHWGIAVLILILAETLGLWYVLNKLVFPPERLTAVLYLYHFSVITTMTAIISVPFNAAIISHEKMGAFAFIAIYETIANVLIILTIPFFHKDNLILYGFLVMMVQVSIRLIYGIYCKRNFSETSGRFYFDKTLFRQMLKFAFWIVNGSIAFMAYTQGLNLLLNAFFGPSVNAARAVATTVQAKVQGFSYNFQVAVNPQITKNYAAGNLEYMHKLIFNSSKYSVLLVFFLSFPLMLECPFILKVWLGDNVPVETIWFVRLTLAIGIISTLTNPMNTSAHATGNIKKFQLWEATTLLLIVPVSYMFLKLGFPAVTVFWVQLVIFVLVQIIRIFIVSPMIKMKKYDYLRYVVFDSIKVILPSMLLPLYLEYFRPIHDATVNFLVICVASLVCTALCIYFFGLSHEVKQRIKMKVINSFLQEK